MTEQRQRQAFLDAIAADPTDDSVCLVFADWLEEHDEPSEADRYRKYHESYLWMTEFASGVGISYQLALTGGCIGSSDDAAYDLCDEGRRAEYWRHRRILTGEPVEDKDDGIPFYCAC